MIKRKLKIGILLAIMIVLLSSIACTLTRPGIRVGPMQTESRSVERGDAETVRADILMGAGELQVSGGAADLLQADFTYNVTELKPEVEFSGGTLSVLTPEVEGVASFWNMDDYRYEWDLRFNNDVAMEMKIVLGAGQADLALGELSLDRLDVDTGAGDVNLDLSGASALTRLDVNLGAGEVTVDLTGDWQNDLDADIQGGVGELTIRLPRDVGVRVEIQKGLGDINASGFTMDGDDFVNAAYGDSNVTLRIDVKAGVGKVNLKLAD